MSTTKAIAVVTPMCAGAAGLTARGGEGGGTEKPAGNTT